MQSIWTAYFKYAVHLDMYVNYEIMYDYYEIFEKNKNEKIMSE